MGGEPGRGPAMTRICWLLVDSVSRMLDPDERDAVRGDFAESGGTGGQALRDLLGLIVRRQASFWKDWRPWLALFGLAVPVGLLLGLSSISLVGSYDLYLWIFRNYGTIDPAILEQIGLTARSGVVHLVCASLLLGSWSWTSGLVLGSLSRRTVWVNGTLFCVVLSVVELSATLNRQYRYSVSGGVFSFTFYRVILPLILQLALVLLPALWGMRQGLRLAPRPLGKTILWVAAIVAMLAIRDWFLGPFRAIRLLTLAASWPVGYLAATTIWRHSRCKTSASRQQRH